MVGVAFFFESEDVDVWSGKNLDAWNYAFKAAGDITEIIVVNKTSQVLANPDIGAYTFSVVQDLPDLPNACTLVCPWLCAEGAVPLWNFDHNVDWYIFGQASVYTPSQGTEVCVPQAGVAAMHSVHIVGVVMTHRFSVKSWL